MQTRDLRAYCAARGFTIIREYIDIGQSGAKNSRPELNELMSDARKRQFDSILVWRFDRFARSTKHLVLAREEFRSLGVQFISYQENIDTTSPLGQALFTIVSAVAQLERDLIREWVSAGIRNARACGKQLGRPRRIVNADELLRLKTEGASLRADCRGVRNWLLNGQDAALHQHVEIQQDIAKFGLVLSDLTHFQGSRRAVRSNSQRVLPNRRVRKE